MCTHMFVRVCICVSMPLSVSVALPLSVCVSMCVSMSASVSASVSVSMSVSVSGSESVSVSVSVSMTASMPVFVSECAFVSVSGLMSVCVCVCARAYFCVCVCVYVCAHVRGHIVHGFSHTVANWLLARAVVAELNRERTAGRMDGATAVRSSLARESIILCLFVRKTVTANPWKQHSPTVDDLHFYGKLSRRVYKLA